MRSGGVKHTGKIAFAPREYALCRRKYKQLLPRGTTGWHTRLRFSEPRTGREYLYKSNYLPLPDPWWQDQYREFMVRRPTCEKHIRRA